jgi:hypothetical protein
VSPDQRFITVKDRLTTHQVIGQSPGTGTKVIWRMGIIRDRLGFYRVCACGDFFIYLTRTQPCCYLLHGQDLYGHREQDKYGYEFSFRHQGP